MLSLKDTLRFGANIAWRAYEAQKEMFVSPHADEAWAWIRTSLKHRNRLATSILIARLKEREDWGGASNYRSDGTSFFVWDARAMNYAIGELYHATICYDSSQRPSGVAGEWVRGIAENVSYSSREELLLAVFGSVALMDPQDFEQMILSLIEPETRSLARFTSLLDLVPLAREV